MREYVIRRLLLLLPVLFLVSIFVFSLIHLTPGDPAAAILGETASLEEVAALRAEMGLDRPLVMQYLAWLGNLVRLDLGHSYFMNQSVAEALASRIVPTLMLALLAESFAVLIAVPLGVIAAVNHGTIIDRALMSVSLFGMSVPSFLLALFLVLILSVQLRWLPVAGYAPPSAGLWAHLRYMIMPALALGLIQIALIARMTRSSMLDVLNMNYISAARARGLRVNAIVYRHALRNAFIPVLTVIGQSFGSLVAGAAVTETIFNIPGLGQLIVNSVARRDYAVIQGGVLLITLMYLLVNLVTDLLYGVIDPRVRLGRR